MARTAVASDAFNRAGPGLGSDWLQLNNWGAGDCTIASSTLLLGAGITGPAGSGTIRWAGTGTFADDQYAKATITTLAFQDANYVCGVIARASADISTSGAQMDFYAAIVDQDNSSGNSFTTRLVKVVNGTLTTLGATVGVTYTNGDTVEIECEGSTIRFFKNGVQQYTRTDTDLTTGKPGVVLSGGGTSIRMDDWEGGSITNPVSDQEGARFGNDDGAEAAHTWAAAQDANVTAPAGQTLVLNMIVNSTYSIGAKTFKLQYRKTGDGAWRDVPVQ